MVYVNKTVKAAKAEKKPAKKPDNKK